MKKLEICDSNEFTDEILSRSWFKSSSKTLKLMRIVLFKCINHSSQECKAQIKKIHLDGSIHMCTSENHVLGCRNSSICDP